LIRVSYYDRNDLQEFIFNRLPEDHEYILQVRRAGETTWDMNNYEFMSLQEAKSAFTLLLMQEKIEW
jgi:hypothetical protein